jgi:hypothetical protein
MARTAVGIMLAVLAVAPIGRAASQVSPEDVPSALLGEVRLLRTTIERVVSAGASGQLILGRLQLQEQRVIAAEHRLQATQAELTVVRQEQKEQEDLLAGYAERGMDGPRSTVPVHLFHGGNLEDGPRLIELGKSRLAELGKSVQRLIAQEAAYASDLAGEQAVWADLNRRLDDVEQLLARRP